MLTCRVWAMHTDYSLIAGNLWRETGRDGHGSQHGQEFVPSGRPAFHPGHPTCCDVGAWQCRENYSPVPPQVRSVPQHGADDRLQLRESEGHDWTSERYQLLGVGRRRAGEAPTAVEELHALYRRYSVRVGQRRHWTDGGGKDGTGQDCEIPG